MDGAVTGPVSHLRDAAARSLGGCILMSETSQQQRNIRKTVVILTVIALLFYFGFILMGVLRA